MRQPYRVFIIPSCVPVISFALRLKVHCNRPGATYTPKCKAARREPANGFTPRTALHPKARQRTPGASYPPPAGLVTCLNQRIPRTALPSRRNALLFDRPFRLTRCWLLQSFRYKIREVGFTLGMEANPRVVSNLIFSSLWVPILLQSPF